MLFPIKGCGYAFVIGRCPITAGLIIYVVTRSSLTKWCVGDDGTIIYTFAYEMAEKTLNCFEMG